MQLLTFLGWGPDYLVAPMPVRFSADITACGSKHTIASKPIWFLAAGTDVRVCPCNIRTSSETVSGFTKYGCDDLAEDNNLKEEGSPDAYKVSGAGYFEQREDQAGSNVSPKPGRGT